MLEAHRTIEVPVEMKDGILEIRVPFNVELLHQVEETLKRSTTRVWFVFERSEKSIIEAYEDFCRPYFPETFDWSQVQPTFAALFFSSVKDELLNSIRACERSMTRTERPTDNTEEKTTTSDPSDSSMA